MITRMCAQLEIRTGRLPSRPVRARARRSASEMQYCWLDNVPARRRRRLPRFARWRAPRRTATSRQQGLTTLGKQMRVLLRFGNSKLTLSINHARMARRAQHLRCEGSERADNRLDKADALFYIFVSRCDQNMFYIVSRCDPLGSFP